MAYSVKFKRRKQRPPAPPLTSKRAAIIGAKVVAAAVLLWVIVQGFIYVHYTMEFSRSNAVWGRQFGSPGNDDAAAVAVDRRGNVFVAGTTDDSLFGTSSGHTDVFVAKYSAAGQLLWGRQYGCDGDETIGGIAADSQGYVYLVGGTEGSCFDKLQGGGDPSNPPHNAFIVKLDSTGSKVWGAQFGVGGDDAATGVAIDQRDSVYVCGDTDGNLFDTNADPLITTPNSPRTSDVWEVRYSPSGKRTWGLQFGAAGDDDAESIAVDSVGESFIAGGTHALFRPFAGDRDAFLAKITSAGTLAWGQQMSERQNSFPTGVACDANGNTYLAADMVFGEGVLHASPGVAEFSSTGIIVQRVEMPANVDLDILTATPDTHGGLLLAGSTDGRAGSKQVFGHGGLARFDSTGAPLWTHVTGGTASSLFDATVIDTNGYIYAAGKSEGKLFSESQGSDDAILVKMNPAGMTHGPLGTDVNK